MTILGMGTLPIAWINTSTSVVPLCIREVGRGWGKQGHAGMEPVVREKRGQGCGRMLRVVVGEFCQREEAGPVGRLIVAVHAEVLLQHRIQPLRLPIRLLRTPLRPNTK